MNQSINHILLRPRGRNPCYGFSVIIHKTEVSLTSKAPNGFSDVSIKFSAPCGSDGGPHGYYWGGRFHKDLFENQHKLEENITLLQKHGITGDRDEILSLLKTPNHEGSGKVIKTTPNSSDRPRKIAAFIPELSTNKKQITGLTYTLIDVDFQKIKKGDRVVVDAALRCDRHWEISQNGFALDCHRDIADRHTRKRVPGHMEFPGFSYDSSEGLPYPNHMLSPVPKGLNLWIDQDPSLNESLLVAMEPLSCCIEAFHPIFMEKSYPKKIAILGDGPNGALLSMVATIAFPEAQIYVVGRTPKKLQIIHDLNPEKIQVMIEGKEKGQSADEQLRKIVGRNNKLDVIIPTFEVPSFTQFSDIVNSSGRVIVWAAGQVGQKNPFKGVGDETKLHHSYGGKNKMEMSALLLCDALATTSPKTLDVIVRYPYVRIPLRNAQEPMQEWLNNKGKYSVEMDGRKTSAKLLFVHSEPE